MTRMYIQPSFLDSCTEHGEWSGGNDQYRGDRSVDFSTFTKGGRARVEAFSDDALAKSKPKAKKIPIASKILSQNVTLNRLDAQEKELDQAFENSEIDLEEYEELLYVLEGKRERAHKSLCKALGKSAEEGAVGYIGVSPEHVSEGPESYRKQGFSSVSGSVPKGSPKGCVKNLKNDVIYLLTGSIVGLSILLTITNT